jgi:hypothetical protein
VVFEAAISGFGGMHPFNGFVMVGFAMGSTANPMPAESLVIALDFLSRGHKYATKAITSEGIPIPRPTPIAIRSDMLRPLELELESPPVLGDQAESIIMLNLNFRKGVINTY